MVFVKTYRNIPNITFSTPKQHQIKSYMHTSHICSATLKKEKFHLILKISVNVKNLECQSNKSTQWSSSQNNEPWHASNRTSGVSCNSDKKQKIQYRCSQCIWLCHLLQDPLRVMVGLGLWLGIGNFRKWNSMK